MCTTRARNMHVAEIGVTTTGTTFHSAFNAADRILSSCFVAVLAIAAVSKATSDVRAFSYATGTGDGCIRGGCGGTSSYLSPDGACTARIGWRFILHLRGGVDGRALRGHSSCGCFGDARVPPLLTAGIDVFAGLWLLAGCRMRLGADGTATGLTRRWTMRSAACGRLSNSFLTWGKPCRCV